MDVQKESKEMLALYSSDCISCKHLSEVGTVAYVACHYSKGNKQCPASEVYFVVVGEAISYARRVLSARDKRFPKLEAKLMKHVSSQSKAFQSKFYDALESGGNL